MKRLQILCESSSCRFNVSIQPSFNDTRKRWLIQYLLSLVDGFSRHLLALSDFLRQLLAFFETDFRTVNPYQDREFGEINHSRFRIVIISEESKQIVNDRFADLDLFP